MPADRWRSERAAGHGQRAPSTRRTVDGRACNQARWAPWVTIGHPWSLCAEATGCGGHSRWELRVQGWDWPTIAERCGYSSKSAALRSVRRLRQSLPEVDVDELRQAAVARALALVRQAAEDVEARRPGGVTAQVRAEGRLASLCGLDAPRHTVTESYERRVEQVFAWLATDERRPPWELEP